MTYVVVGEKCYANSDCISTVVQRADYVSQELHLVAKLLSHFPDRHGLVRIYVYYYY